MAPGLQKSRRRDCARHPTADRARPTRRLFELRIGVDYYDDLARAADNLSRLGIALGLFNRGPPPPRSFMPPEDLAALMTGTHSCR
jgi:hypothetical protein